MLQNGENVKIIKKAYLSYFGVKLGDQDKLWALHLACRSCVEHLKKKERPV